MVEVKTGEILAEDKIIVRSDKQTHPYIMRILTRQDLAAVMQLQEKIVSKIKDKQLYVPIPEPELLFMLEGAGEVIGIFVHNELHAACALLCEMEYEESMACEAGFSVNDLPLTAQLELSLVDATLQGHKFQCRMATILAERARKTRNTRYVFTTLSPYNYASIQTVTSMGMHIVKLDKMYFDWERYLVYRDFMQPVELKLDQSVIIANTDLAGQRQLLSANYHGYKTFKDEEGIKVVYAPTALPG